MPGQDPVLSIPGRVCQDAVSSAQVKTLLPDKGESFEEGAVGFMAGLPRGLGKCELSGGGKDLDIRYSRIQDPDFTWETVQRNVSKPGNIPISLGEAGGYIGGGSVELFVDCPYEKGRKDLLRVVVGIGGVPKIEDSAMKANISGLAADVARAVARDVVGCEGAADLPDGAPKIG